MRIRGLVVALAVAISASVAAPARASEWTADDILRPERAGAIAVSRDGAHSAWIKSTWITADGKPKQIGNLWLTNLASGESIQLTQGDDGVSSPQFSPDGTRIAFVTSRKPVSPGKERADRQVWAINLAGGEAYPLTSLDRSVGDFAWIDDTALALLAQESKTLYEQEVEAAEDTSVVVEDAENEPPVRLYRFDIEKKSLTRLTTNDDWMRSLAVSPDGARAFVQAQVSLSFTFDEKHPPRNLLINLATGETRELWAGERVNPGRVSWAPDSSGFYFTNNFSSHPIYTAASITELFWCDAAGAARTKVDLDWDRAVGGGISAIEGGVIVDLADGVYRKPVIYSRNGDTWSRRDITSAQARHIGSIEASADGSRIVYQHSTTTTPPQLFTARLDAGAITDAVQITDLNASWKDKPMGRTEVIHWEGAEGDTVEGLIFYPYDYEEGDRFPLIVNPHGGPASANVDAWSSNYVFAQQLWRQRGAGILWVNYHGSSDYGLEWVESIQGRYYELEIPDIENGVDHLIERGLVDPDRLAVVGWSNGGILGAELITRTNRYKAASIGAADVEWISDWANVAFGASFDNYYFLGPPWEQLEHYIEKSPFFRLTEVTTPTIIFTGDKDVNVPPHQSWSLFRALQQIGKAPARLVVFPGEPHGLNKPAHQKRKLEETLTWLDRYLFESYDPADKALKESAPLAALMKRAAAGRVDGRYGVEVDGALTPELVRHDGLLISRFEVTRAQFADYDSDYRFEPVEANLPATDITFEQARDYAAWLADRTGRPLRLPTDEEAKKLAGAGGNTLAHWAGYAPNPDDLDRLDAIIDDLPAGALLREVGSGDPAGDNAVFDLDGNAAEWAVDASGAGVLIGPSADRAIDKRTSSPAQARPAYRGIRVVADAP
ncbi:MAG: prolyl oligopeptidase family serine peptidase [Phycisphaerales bacterium]